MIKLTTKNGELYLNDEILIVRKAGDCDTIRFPLITIEDRQNLASALFDEYEIGEIDDRTVLLPDNTVFNIDENVRS